MKIALTGGATGIGAEVAAQLTASGHEVIAFDIADPGDIVARWIPTDLSDISAIDASLAQVDGPLDALINNAGMPPREGLEETILKVNFLALRHVTTALQGKLAPDASIVNVASRAGAFWRDNLEQVKALIDLEGDTLTEFISTQGIDATRAYNLSKEAVIVWSMAQTETMVARGMRINSVSPAAVSTGILKDFAAAFGERMTQNVARAGRPGTAREIADVIVFMAGPESRWIKGQDIVIDGGMSAMAQSDQLELTDATS